jgi:hypothetical protein
MNQRVKVSRQLYIWSYMRLQVKSLSRRSCANYFYAMPVPGPEGRNTLFLFSVELKNY